MGTDVTISMTLLISLVSLACSVYGTFSGSKKQIDEQNDKDNKRQVDIERHFAVINVKLDEFCEKSNQMLQENAKATAQLKEVSEQLIRVSEQVNTLFKYKDDHEGRIKALESKR